MAALALIVVVAAALGAQLGRRRPDAYPGPRIAAGSALACLVVGGLAQGWLVGVGLGLAMAAYWLAFELGGRPARTPR
jgi:hypothetical protein